MPARRQTPQRPASLRHTGNHKGSMTMTFDLFRLDGRVALVTGGDKGLGQAMAIGLAQAGADVAIVSRSGDNAASLAAIVAAGRRGLGLTFDLARPEAA